MSETRQRWRLTFSRGPEARFLSHLDAVKLWERAFRRGSIPIATTEGFNPRPRLIFAAPLPLGMLAEHELADLYLAERLTLADLRRRLERDLPLGYRLVGLHDVWVGAPALATQLAAADYRLGVAGVSAEALGAAATRLLAAESLDRERRREAKAVAYDLRPLVISLEIGETEPLELGEGGRTDVTRVRMRLRHTQDLGAGRPEEVVAALGDEISSASAGGRPVETAALEIVEPVRERLWLGSELREP